MLQTTPPCTEGLRWHVFNEQLPMSYDAFQRLEQHTARTAAGPGEPQQLYRHNERPVQPLGPRTLFFSDTGDAEVLGGVGGVCGGENRGHMYGKYGSAMEGDDDGKSRDSAATAA